MVDSRWLLQLPRDIRLFFGMLVHQNESWYPVLTKLIHHDQSWKAELSWPDTMSHNADLHWVTSVPQEREREVTFKISRKTVKAVSTISRQTEVHFVSDQNQNYSEWFNIASVQSLMSLFATENHPAEAASLFEEDQAEQAAAFGFSRLKGKRETPLQSLHLEPCPKHPQQRRVASSLHQAAPSCCRNLKQNNFEKLGRYLK